MTAAAPAPLYVTRDGDAARDRDIVLSIWRGNLGQASRIEGKYDWFYLSGPAGAPLLQLLQHAPDEAWIGACSAGRRRMLWHGRELRAGVLVDMAVVPEHRSLGPALILQQSLLAASRRELDLIYGFPNPKSAAVFKRIGYRKFTDIVRHARVLRHAGYLARRLPAPLARVAGPLLDLAQRARDALRSIGAPRLRASWSERVDARVDTLWASAPHGEGLVAVRDAAHLRWRFDQAPLDPTRYLLLGDAHGALRAWFATQAIDGTLHVRDYWSDDAHAGLGVNYVDALVGAARGRGCSAVSVEIAGPAARSAGWVARGFVARSQRPVFGCWSAATADNTGEFDLFLTSADEDE
jgi:hypothetical protein